MKIKPTRKHTSTYGKHVYKPTISVILVCACGDKYIKTRLNQETCVRCMVKVGTLQIVKK